MCENKLGPSDKLMKINWVKDDPMRWRSRQKPLFGMQQMENGKPKAENGKRKTENPNPKPRPNPKLKSNEAT